MEPHSFLKITIIGTASPAMTLRSGNVGTCVLVEHEAGKMLFDVGPGATTRLDSHDVDIRDVDEIYLTHHHWDHVGDLPHFVLGRWEQSLFRSIGGKGFAGDLKITGPRDTKQLYERFFGENGAYANCIATRYAPDIGLPLYSARGIEMPLPPLSGEVREVKAGDRWTSGDLTISAGSASHCQPYLESVGFRVDAGGHSFVFAGDTAPCDGIVELASGADLLLHDCNVNSDVRGKLGRTALHSTAEEVGEVASKANVKMVVAVHHGIPATEQQRKEQLRDRIASTFDGEIVIATEGDVFHV